MIEALKSRAQSQGLPWQTLLKEAMQVIFLETFYALPEATGATFQGGTSLRLLYGGPRHSEDLDFVTLSPLEFWDGLRGQVFEKLKAQEALLQGTLEMTAQKSYSKILRWKFKWESPTGGEKIFVRVEWASFPAHTKELLPLARPPGMPSGTWVVIPVESREEILTDKLAAIAGRPYLKGRDFFDLWFLRSQGVSIQPALLRQKLKDYNTSEEGLRKRSLEITGEVLQRDLQAFLPSSVRQPLETDGYQGILKASRETLGEATSSLAALGRK